MKIYIAAPWVEKEQARAAARLFEDAGFDITKRWWDHREVPGYLTNTTDDEELVTQAIEDVNGVLDADMFVLLNLSKSEGKAVETGLAIGAGIPIILIGGKSNLFHYLPMAECASVEDAVDVAQLVGSNGRNERFAA